MINHYGQGAVLQAGFHGVQIMKNFLHLFRQGGGTDIPVMGSYAKERIPDTAADDIRREAGPRQAGQQIGNSRWENQITIHNSQFIIHNY